MTTDKGEPTLVTTVSNDVKEDPFLFGCTTRNLFKELE